MDEHDRRTVAADAAGDTADRIYERRCKQHGTDKDDVDASLAALAEHEARSHHLRSGLIAPVSAPWRR